MADGWGRMGRNSDTTARWREMLERESRERAEEEHLADEIHPTWWIRLRRRLRRSKG